LSWNGSVSYDNNNTAHSGTHPEPLRTLGAKAKAFETETDTSLTMVVLVGFFVAFLATNSTDWGGDEYVYKILRGT
jgi:hypothetical protein